MDEKQFITSLEAKKYLIQYVLTQAESCRIRNKREALDISR